MHRSRGKIRALPGQVSRVLQPAPARWWLPSVLALLIAVDDVVLLSREPSYAVVGVLDEPAHLATSLILLSGVAAACRRRAVPLSTGFVLALVAAGNALDLDHLPLIVLGSDRLTAGTPRPYPHSLLTVGLLLGLAAFGWALSRRVAGRPAVRRRGAVIASVALGTAVGVTGHLLRDLSTAAVPLLWPWRWDGYTIPTSAYLVGLFLLAVLAGLAVRGDRRRPEVDRARSPAGYLDDPGPKARAGQRR